MWCFGSLCSPCCMSIQLLSSQVFSKVSAAAPEKSLSNPKINLAIRQTRWSKNPVTAAVPHFSGPRVSCCNPRTSWPVDCGLQFTQPFIPWNQASHLVELLSQYKLVAGEMLDGNPTTSDIKKMKKGLGQTLFWGQWNVKGLQHLPTTPVSVRPANLCMALTALVTDVQACSWPVEGSGAGR